MNFFCPVAKLLVQTAVQKKIGMLYIHLEGSKRQLKGTMLLNCSMTNTIQEPLKRLLNSYENLHALTRLISLSRINSF